MRGVRVSSDASGRQATLIGAFGLVPRPAETQPGVLVARQATRSGAVQIAVGHERANDGQAHLTTVRVPGQDQVGTIVGHAIQHPQVGACTTPMRTSAAGHSPATSR